MKKFIALACLLVTANAYATKATRIVGDTLEGGAATNWLINPDFDAATYSQGWTITTASGAVETSTIYRGKQSAKLTFAASTGDIAQTVTPAQNTLGVNLEASCKVATTLATIQVCAISGTTEVQCVNAPASGNFSYVSASMPGPANGTAVGVRVKTSSSTTGSFYADDCYVGPSRQLGSGFMATDWTAYTPTFSASFGSTTGVSFFYKRSGDHLFVVGTVTLGTRTSAVASISLPAGLTIDSAKVILANTTAAAGEGVGYYYANAAASNGNIVTATGTSTAGVYFAQAVGGTGPFLPVTMDSVIPSSSVVGVQFSVPISGWTSSQSAYRTDVTPASWSGHHNTSCSWTESSTTYADFGSGQAGCALVEDTNRNMGAVAGYGATSGASAAPGIVFTPPRAGRWQVQAKFASVYSTGGSAMGSFVMTDGSNNILDGVTFASTNNGNLTLEKIIDVPSVASTTIKIRGAYTGSASTQTIEGRSSPALSAITWNVTELDAPMPAPYLTGSVTSTTTSTERIERVIFSGNAAGSVSCTGTPCTISSQSGSWVTSVTRSGTGAYVVNVAAGEWSNPLVSCTCSGMGLSAGTTCGAQWGGASNTGISVNVRGWTGSGQVDDAVSLICMGAR